MFARLSKMGNNVRSGGGIGPPGMGVVCGCNADTCMNDPRGEHVIVASASNAEVARFVTPRSQARNTPETDPVTPREDGGLCIGDIHGSAGTIRYHNGDVYTGEWRSCRAVGYGRVVRPDGSTYEGQWANDAAHGEGTETYPDGSWYRGGYTVGIKFGFGIFHWAHGPQFCGQFEDNVFHGEGSYYWGDGRVYTGQWSKNEFNGHGRMGWPDGQVYEGQYDTGRKDGEGTFIWADGRRFTGKWRNGKQHGLGVFYDAKGSSRSGEWNDGHRHRWVEADGITTASKDKGTAAAAAIAVVAPALASVAEEPPTAKELSEAFEQQIPTEFSQQPEPSSVEKPKIPVDNAEDVHSM